MAGVQLPEYAAAAVALAGVWRFTGSVEGHSAQEEETLKFEFDEHGELSVSDSDMNCTVHSCVVQGTGLTFVQEYEDAVGKSPVHTRWQARVEKRASGSWALVDGRWSQSVNGDFLGERIAPPSNPETQELRALYCAVKQGVGEVAAGERQELMSQVARAEAAEAAAMAETAQAEKARKEVLNYYAHDAELTGWTRASLLEEVKRLRAHVETNGSASKEHELVVALSERRVDKTLMHQMQMDLIQQSVVQLTAQLAAAREGMVLGGDSYAVRKTGDDEFDHAWGLLSIAALRSVEETSALAAQAATTEATSRPLLQDLQAKQLLLSETYVKKVNALQRYVRGGRQGRDISHELGEWLESSQLFSAAEIEGVQQWATKTKHNSGGLSLSASSPLNRSGLLLNGRSPTGGGSFRSRNGSGSTSGAPGVGRNGTPPRAASPPLGSPRGSPRGSTPRQVDGTPDPRERMSSRKRVAELEAMERRLLSAVRARESAEARAEECLEKLRASEQQVQLAEAEADAFRDALHAQQLALDGAAEATADGGDKQKGLIGLGPVAPEAGQSSALLASMAMATAAPSPLASYRTTSSASSSFGGGGIAAARGRTSSGFQLSFGGGGQGLSPPSAARRTSSPRHTVRGGSGGAPRRGNPAASHASVNDGRWPNLPTDVVTHGVPSKQAVTWVGHTTLDPRLEFEDSGYALTSSPPKTFTRGMNLGTGHSMMEQKPFRGATVHERVFK